MNSYTLFNVLFMILAVWVMFLKLGSMKQLLQRFRIGLILVLIGYPWDYYAISLGVWVYPNDPGPRIYGVPANDMWLLFSSTLIITSLLDGLGGPKTGQSSHRS